MLVEVMTPYAIVSSVNPYMFIVASNSVYAYASDVAIKGFAI
jgi:hypothetical protein